MFAARSLFLCAVAVAACALPGESEAAQCGLASWYHGARRTHGGADGFTAAHRSLPFGTQVRVTHQKNGREVTVRINDRGPFIPSRVIDLSEKAKKELGIDGLAKVCLSVVTDKDLSAPNAARGWAPQVVPLPERAPEKRAAATSRGEG